MLSKTLTISFLRYLLSSCPEKEKALDIVQWSITLAEPLQKDFSVVLWTQLMKVIAAHASSCVVLHVEDSRLKNVNSNISLSLSFNLERFYFVNDINIF